ncbi:MAG: APC family permease [Planctomycetota bacterium]
MSLHWRELVLGKAKDPLGPHTFHRLTLIAFFAWVGLGADGLSSSCYGPEEAFHALEGHTYLAVPLALFMALTVFIISASYSQLIEAFPSGGGGYLVTTKLLGPHTGLVCGSALILDYVLTIAISIAGAIAALISVLPADLAASAVPNKWLFALFALAFLIVLNLRGVKESIVVLLPIFLLFLLTHAFALALVFTTHTGDFIGIFTNASSKIIEEGNNGIGWVALFALFIRAYSIGGGTYTGIEAVSNSMQVLREPRAATGKRTMLYMAVSLAVTAAGLMFGYLILQVTPVTGKTLNAVLLEGAFAPLSSFGVDSVLVWLALLAEGALLIVAAQAGFIGGPRTLATMALDGWVPSRFRLLSSRLVIQDGVLFMGGAAALFIVFTGASVQILVILYSINVFLTFTLSQLGMCRHWIATRAETSDWRRRFALNAVGLVLTSCVLVAMLYYKLGEGGWITILITSLTVVVCLLVRKHYTTVRTRLRELDTLVAVAPSVTHPTPPRIEPEAPTAILLVSGYNGLGVHSLYTLLRKFPSYFRNFLFVSVGIVDFGEFKGQAEITRLKERTSDELQKYVAHARSMGLAAQQRHAIGTDLVDEIEDLAKNCLAEFPRAVIFAGQLVFEEENWLTRSLHSQSAFEIQRRLHFSGLPVVLLPIRVHSGGAV